LKQAAVLIMIITIFAPGCSVDNPGTDIYVMEELEAASSIEDPRRRVEHLRMFLSSYPDHHCRKFACRRVFNTLAEEMGREEEAFRFISGFEEKEEDAEILSALYYAKFSYLMDTDSPEAVRYAEEVLEKNDVNFRTYIYMGFDLNNGNAPEMSIRLFRKGLNEAGNSVQRSFAGMVLGEQLYQIGKDEEGFEVLMEERGNPFSEKYIGQTLWERGLRRKALDAYIQLVAGVPGMRDRVKIDSLYTLVYRGGREELDAEILRRRIDRKKLLFESAFVDTRGKTHRFSDLTGRKLVIGAWSPD